MEASGPHNEASAKHSMTPTELYKYGLAYYRKTRYEAALLCFTQALDGGIEDVVKVLDNRSAVHTKLGNHQAALSDSRRMIKQDNSNVAGYLRAGKILWTINEKIKAKEIYEKGIARVPKTSTNIELLHAVYAKAVEFFDRPKRKDPFKTLPLEVVQMILCRLEFTDICYSINVSKPWSKLLASIPTLWTNLDFIAAKKTVLERSIRKYIKQGQGLPTRVTLPKYANNLQHFITTRCRGLYELVIPGGIVGTTMLQAAPCVANLKTIITGRHCVITSDTLDQLLENGKALERAEFHNVIGSTRHSGSWNGDLSKLRTLVMVFDRERRGNPSQQILDLDKLVKKTPNLRKLTLHSDLGSLTVSGQVPSSADFSGLKLLEDLDISGIIADRGPIFPSSLLSLNISNNIWTPGDAVPNRLTRLVRLSISDSRILDDDYFKTIIDANKGNLTHVDVEGFWEGLLHELIVSGYFQSVIELKLGCCSVNDAQMTELAKHAPNIKRLSLKGTQITGVGVKTLVTALKDKLEYLCLDNCQKCSPDANTWAIAMGVKTSFKFPDNSRGGRKVRQ